MHDLTATTKSHEVGDLVLVSNEAKTTGKSPKLQNVWQGPFIVTKKIGSVLFQVKSQKKEKILHHNRLKAFRGEFVPAWVQKERFQLGNPSHLGTIDEGDDLSPQKQSLKPPVQITDECSLRTSSPEKAEQ